MELQPVSSQTTLPWLSTITKVSDPTSSAWLSTRQPAASAGVPRMWGHHACQNRVSHDAHAKLICIEFISNYFLHNLVPAQKPYARTNCVNINEYVFFTIYEFIYSMIGTRRHSTQYSDLLLQASGMPSRPYSSRARG